MDAFYERLIVRAATIDEILSDAFEPLPGQKGDTDRPPASRRVVPVVASGDWSLFGRRLERDGLRSVRCWRDLPLLAARLPLPRRPGRGRDLDRGGAATPGQSRKPLRRLTGPSPVRSSTCSRRWSNKPKRASAAGIDARVSTT